MLDPKRDDPPAPTKPDTICDCPACAARGWTYGTGENRPTCEACQGEGVLSLHVEDENEDSCWEAALELLSAFNIRRDPEAWGYESEPRDGKWVLAGDKVESLPRATVLGEVLGHLNDIFGRKE